MSEACVFEFMNTTKSETVPRKSRERTISATSLRKFPKSTREIRPTLSGQLKCLPSAYEVQQFHRQCLWNLFHRTRFTRCGCDD